MKTNGVAEHGTTSTSSTSITNDIDIDIDDDDDPIVIIENEKSNNATITAAAEYESSCHDEYEYNETYHEYSKYDDNDDDDDDDDTGDTDRQYYTHFIESIKTSTGLDIGYTIQWPKRNCCCIPTPPQLLPLPLQLLPVPVPVVVVPPVPSPLSNTDDSTTTTTTTREIINTEFVTLTLSTQLPSDCIAPMFHGTQWAGTTIWRSAIVGLQYLQYYSQQQQQQRSIQFVLDPTTTLLELGCGLGVPGMILHALTKCRTILTDKSDLIGQLQTNLESNFYNTTNEPNNNNEQILARPLDWSVEGVHELLTQIGMTTTTTTSNHSKKSNSTIDVVLACDCIYEPLYGTASWRNLLRVQNELLRLYPKAMVLTACHRRPADGIDSYIAAVDNEVHISHIEQLHIPFAHSPVVELYQLHGGIR